MTIEAIQDAALQVLLGAGIEAVTTTRVAERAGVSVGTLYQYYPNKQALLTAVLSRHLGAVVSAVEAACLSHQGCELDDAARALVHAYFDAKLARPEVSRALYAIPSDQGRDMVMAPLMQRAQLAVCKLLASCPDARFDDLPTVAFMVCTAVNGPVQTLLGDSGAAQRAPALRKELVALIVGYLQAVNAGQRRATSTGRRAAVR